MAGILLLYWVLGTSVLRTNLGSDVRLFNDDSDRTVYFTRGSWLPTQTVAYRDVFSEYPQVPTLLFGLLRLPASLEAGPVMQQRLYLMLFSGLMLILLFCLGVIIERMLSPGRKNLVLLLLLPAPLYFSYNRFDVLPALLCLIVLILVREKYWLPATALLGVATLTKWYPALLVLPIAVYMYYQRVRLSSIIHFFLAYGVVCCLIVMPTFLTGGLKAVLVPYLFHEGRTTGISALPTLLQPIMDTIPVLTAVPRLEKSIFLLLQFGFSAGAVLIRLDSFRKLLNWVTLTIAAYVLFSRIWSPQWLLWIFPLLLLLIRSRSDAIMAAGYGILTYLQFPITFDLFGKASPQMHGMAWAGAVLLLVILLSLVIHAVQFRAATQSAEDGLSTA